LSAEHRWAGGFWQGGPDPLANFTQARADRILDRISKGHIPFWDGIHRRR